MSVDVVYIAASAHDARLTRICVASVRAVYPDIAVKLLVGGPLEQGLAGELARFWSVGLADLPRIDYGWGFVKLEPLFGRPGERFLVLDSDTVITGPVLERWQAGDFLVDDEAQEDPKARELYYDWDKLREVLPQTVKPRFVFNSGQWFGTAGVLTRDDFEPVLAWDQPPRLRYPDRFMPGDQGVLNWVLNQKTAAGLSVDRQVIMRWPGHGMDGLSADAVSRRAAPALAVHWAGMKKARISQMAGADLLTHFERLYYARLPGGEGLRLLRASRYAQAPLRRRIGNRLKGLVGA